MPPISGSQASVLNSQSDIARCGATRAGTHSSKVFVKIAGVQRAYNRPSSDSRILVDSLRIKGANGSIPNRAACTALGFVPDRLDEIVITLGSVNRHRLEFGGVIINTRQRFIVDPAAAAFDLACVDHGWQLNALVTGHFTGTGTEIAIELVQTYAPGFSTTKIQAGLATVQGGISFTKVPLRVALDRLAVRVGARWRPDYRKRVLFGTADHLFLTNPRPLTMSLRTFLFDPDSFYVERDRSQQITRAHFEGGGFVTLAEIQAGETSIPISAAPAEWYGDDGGEVIIGDSQQIVQYAGRLAGGEGGLVGPGAAPATPAILALANGAGVTSGLHELTVVFKTATGRSIPGPVASITVGAVPPPTVAPTPAAPTGGGSVDPGDHDYVMTLVTAVGETTPTPVSASATVTASPTAAPTFAIGSPYSDGTTGAAFTAALKYAYVYADGSESALSPESAVITVPANTGWDATVPSTQPAGVVSRRLYMRVNSAAYTRFANLAFTDPSSFSNTSGADTGFRARTLAASGSPTGVAKQTIPLTVPTSPLGIVTNRKLYRRFNATGTHKLAATLDNVVTSYNDPTANSGLGADAPSSNTATANQIFASGIAIGPPDVTDRELYMSPAGGGARKRALTIANNVDETGTITMSDATLAGQLAEPATDTSGLTQESGQVLPGATELEVAGAGALPSQGWAVIGNGQQVIRYTGNTGAELTGIPSTGPGAITAAVQYNSTVTAAPQLIGIPTGSPSAGSITNTIPKGAQVNLWVTVDNVDAQAEVSAKLDPDDELGGLAGVIPDVLTDQRIARAEALARATAHLDSQDDENVTLGFQTLDLNAIEGRTQVADLVAPLSVAETLQIQETEVAWTDADPPIPPVRTVTASTKRFTFDELLRQIRENR